MFYNKWSTDSWHKYSCAQMPFYPFLSETVRHISSILSASPPLVTIEQIKRLKAELLLVSARKSFLLHCGTCAETFKQTTQDYVTRQTNMAHVLASQMEKIILKPVVKIARLAGQFGKPRTDMMQNEMLNYFGDIVNQISPSLHEREPQPENMLHAYDHSKKMIEFMRQPSDSSPCFLSHEAFLLPYEAALTREHEETSDWYNLATHFPWLGKRSLYLNSPHIEYMRGIHNPIGIKLSNVLSTEWVIDLIKGLNPQNDEARIVLIHRFGVDHIETCLPQYIQAIEKEHLNVIWVVDPMHGNTTVISEGRKFRSTQKIASEILLSKEIHHTHGSYLGGIHLECVNEPILECADHPSDIPQYTPYTSAMDPRLNLQQATDLIKAFVG
jgi:3-deoxy-7-phosphoheptulonate synthase